MDIRIIITAPDGVKQEVDISDKRYINLQDIRQKAEIEYLKRQMQKVGK